MRKLLIAGSLVLAVASSTAHAKSTVTTSEKILLQATMQQSIESKLVDGKFYFFDPKVGRIRSLFPAKPHPLILSIGDHFIVCADFRNADGESVNVDFFVARQDNGFVIFDTVVDDHEAITKLMETGDVSVVR